MKKVATIAMALLLGVAVIASCGSSAVREDKVTEEITEDSGLITVGFSHLQVILKLIPFNIIKNILKVNSSNFL